MKGSKCKICGGKLFDLPLLKFKNMPSRAQFLPSKNQLKYDKGVTLNIFQCQFCGVVQLKNKPVSYYKSVIRASGISEEMKKFRIKQFNQFVERFSLQGKKVIEIGCGGGEFLTIMKGTGAKVYGIEYNKRLVNNCHKFGLNVEKGFINENTKIKNAPFDGFFMLSYLEHLPEPNSTLKGIYNNLKQEAVGIIEVPNFNMIIEKNIFSEFMLDHLFYFTKETFKTTLNINGFEIIECSEIWHDYIISAIVKKREKINLSPMIEHQKKISNEIDRYLLKFRDKKIAIWGAGHQALAVLCSIKSYKKIKYVIDSASFKQGKYTPVTHIPIVSPNMLDLEPVDTVIIMAGSYSEEVAKIIKEKSGEKINVFILRDFGLEKI